MKRLVILIPLIVALTTGGVATASAPVVAPVVNGPRSKLVWSLPTNAKVVAITFDAGADTGYAAQILDILAAKGVRATFGLTGRWAAANPSLVRRMAAEGHQVINHTNTHHSFTGVSRAKGAVRTTAARRAELAAADATISALTGRSTKPFWRPPYGDTNKSVQVAAGAAGYSYEIMWTVDSWGWRGIPATAIVHRVLTLNRPGAILAFHVGAASQDVAAIGPIIDGLLAQGFSFVTVAQAFGM
jgi:peptidoglycan/xylan/chitin deacetylase (PgdA/CDA1 family)